VHFLYLHHLFRDEEAAFHALLRCLGESHTFISYSDAVARVRDGRVDRPYVTLSMDDGLKTCRRAATIMNDVGARACFFLVTSMVGATDPLRIREFCAERLHKPPLEFLSWDDAEALLRQGHEIGSHTRTHVNLAALGIDQLVEEVDGAAEEVRRRLGAVEHFAWPYGRFTHMSRAAFGAVFDAGFVSCASAERGCHVAGTGPIDLRRLCLRREHVIGAWPVSHSLFFIARSSRRASSGRQTNPDALLGSGER
jgi:peptidoglycan/xylan/chitin deacetylase (PgdA/CDA1 family)